MENKTSQLDKYSQWVQQHPQSRWVDFNEVFPNEVSRKQFYQRKSYFNKKRRKTIVATSSLDLRKGEKPYKERETTFSDLQKENQYLQWALSGSLKGYIDRLLRDLQK